MYPGFCFFFFFFFYFLFSIFHFPFFFFRFSVSPPPLSLPGTVPGGGQIVGRRYPSICPIDIYIHPRRCCPITVHVPRDASVRL